MKPLPRYPLPGLHARFPFSGLLLCYPQGVSLPVPGIHRRYRHSSAAVLFLVCTSQETVGEVAATGASHGNGLVSEVAMMPRGVRPTQRYRYASRPTCKRKSGPKKRKRR